MNIFEGSRRIAYSLAAAVSAIALFYTATHEPFLSERYLVSSPNSPFERTTKQCPNDSGSHSFARETDSGKSVYITLCLLPMPFGEDRELLIPYKELNGELYGAASYSREVDIYEKELEGRFSFSDADNDRIKKEISSEYWRNWMSNMRILGICLAVFAGLVYLVGWITRGFMGIPRGMDKKPKNPAS